MREPKRDVPGVPTADPLQHLSAIRTVSGDLRGVLVAVAPGIDRSGGPSRGVMGRQKETLCSREHQLVWYEKTFGFFFFSSPGRSRDPGLPWPQGKQEGEGEHYLFCGEPKRGLITGCTQPGLGG